MKHLLRAILVLLFFATLVLADGVWSSNGYVITNVSTQQRGKEVTISGRVSGGAAKSQIYVTVSVVNDKGNTSNALAVIQNYTGRGELFEAKFISLDIAQTWKVVDVKAH